MTEKHGILQKVALNFLSLRMSLALAACGATAQSILWSVSEPANLFSDFYKAYFAAAERLWQQGPTVTWETSGAAATGFVNLPILAYLFVPLALLGEPLAGWTFLGLGIAATAAAYILLLRFGQFTATSGALLALTIAASGPLVNSLREGNTTHFILLALVIALLLWGAGKEYAAGLVIGLCALFKIPLMLFGLYFLLRGKWRIAAGGATTICTAFFLSLAVFGLDINIAWYRNCIEPFMGGGMPAFNVQSVDGFLARLESGHTKLMEWTLVAMPVWHTVVRSLTLATIFLLACLALFRSGDRIAASDRPGERDTLEFSIVLVLAIVTSPVSWSHYYLLLLLPWALYLGGQLPNDAATRWLMGCGMVLSSLPVIALPLGPGMVGAVVSRTLVSAWLFGGLLMLAALLRGALFASQPVVQVRSQAAPP